MSPASTPLPDSPALLARRDSFVRTNSNLGKSESASIPDLALDNTANEDAIAPLPADSMETPTESASATATEDAKDDAVGTAEESDEALQIEKEDMEVKENIEVVPSKGEGVKDDHTPIASKSDSITGSQELPAGEEAASASASPTSPPPQAESQPVLEPPYESPSLSSPHANPASDALSPEEASSQSSEAKPEEADPTTKDITELFSAETKSSPNTDTEVKMEKDATVDGKDAPEPDSKSSPTPVESEASKPKSPGVGIEELQQRLKQVEQRFTGKSSWLLCHRRALAFFGG